MAKKDAPTFPDPYILGLLPTQKKLRANDARG